MSLTFLALRLLLWIVSQQTSCGLYPNKHPVDCIPTNILWIVSQQTSCGLYPNKHPVDCIPTNANN